MSSESLPSIISIKIFCFAFPHVVTRRGSSWCDVIVMFVVFQFGGEGRKLRNEIGETEKKV
jgi:hypothetical protein